MDKIFLLFLYVANNDITCIVSYRILVGRVGRSQELLGVRVGRSQSW